MRTYYMSNAVTGATIGPFYRDEDQDFAYPWVVKAEYDGPQGEVNTTTPTRPITTPLSTQVGGDHYKTLVIQPVEYIHKNRIGFMEGNVIKYVTRWRDKNGIADLEKAKHYIELLIELERI